ncbi:MAG: hypothetical protein WC764_00330 [Candidatus Paceibacterota bacterium]
MSELSRRIIAILAISALVAFGVFGFFFMLHNDNATMSTECPIGAVNPECPISLFAHLDAWRGIFFNATQIFLFFVAVNIFYLAIRKLSAGFTVLLAHKIRRWQSKKISELQLLYSILFSDGIINSKITPHIQY